MVKNKSREKVFIKETVKVGNSSGVILPKKYLGSKVKIKIINEPLDIKKETMNLLRNKLKDIRGIYIIDKTPPKVIAVSNNMKEIIKNKVKISIVPLAKLRKDIRKDYELKEKIINAKTIINNSLLDKLKKIKR